VKKIAIIALLFLVLLVSGCSTDMEVTIRGYLIAQEHDEGFWYDITTYTLQADNQTYTFKVRDGWAFILNRDYVFKLKHIEDDEFIAISVEQER